MSVKALKYQKELESRGVSADCPQKVNVCKKIPAFRFVYTPIEHGHNFLPNVLIDEIKNISFNYSADPKRKHFETCKRCAISLYDTLESIKCRWDSASQQFKENYGFTHIAEGELNEGDGLMGDISNSGHFSFYEFDSANIHENFKLKIAI